MNVIVDGCIDFDPKHVRTGPDRADKYVTVYQCPTCGVVGSLMYRSPYEPCPRCGDKEKPDEYVAAWVSKVTEYRVPFKWWRPSTWAVRRKHEGAWIPRSKP